MHGRESQGASGILEFGQTSKMEIIQVIVYKSRWTLNGAGRANRIRDPVRETGAQRMHVAAVYSN
jgi:hypothetical protein